MQNTKECNLTLLNEQNLNYLNSIQPNSLSTMISVSEDCNFEQFVAGEVDVLKVGWISEHVEVPIECDYGANTSFSDIFNSWIFT